MYILLPVNDCTITFAKPEMVLICNNNHNSNGSIVGLTWGKKIGQPYGGLTSHGEGICYVVNLAERHQYLASLMKEYCMNMQATYIWASDTSRSMTRKPGLFLKISTGQPTLSQSHNCWYQLCCSPENR
jgi:hypothetical protein